MNFSLTLEDQQKVIDFLEAMGFPSKDVMNFELDIKSLDISTMTITYHVAGETLEKALSFAGKIMMEKE